MARRRRRSYRYSGSSYRDFASWSPYVPVAERRREALRTAQALRREGRDLSPVVIEGRTITHTFWGQAWCRNLEHYSDYANRLPRGRTYVRNGSVIDLAIDAGQVRALVYGSELYRIEIDIAPVPARRWKAIRARTEGGIGSLIELLEGRLSESVMASVSDPAAGLFPAPREIALRCSCPDRARLCKHLSAVLYGIGARLDTRPELLFRLRGVDPGELVADAGRLAAGGPGDDGPAGGRRKRLAGDLAAIFGVEIDPGAGDGPARRGRKKAKTRKKKATKRATKKAPEKEATRKRAPGKASGGKKKKATRVAPAKKARGVKKSAGRKAPGSTRARQDGPPRKKRADRETGGGRSKKTRSK